MAQLDVSGGVESWRYLTTDHLGTPVAATSAAGALLWQGGFEPFGADWSGAGGAGVFLRFPGQWEEGVGGGSEPLRYNLYRWYEVGAGRYTKPDPAGPIEQGRIPENLYGYALSNPIFYIDSLGLDSRWYAPGVVYNAWNRPVCAVFGDFECLVVKPGRLSNPLLDADFILVPGNCEWIKIAVGIATVRRDGNLSLPPSSRLTGGGREADQIEQQRAKEGCRKNCECNYCG